MEYSKMRVCGLGFAIGITWGLCVLLIGLIALVLPFPNMATPYIGYPTLVATITEAVFRLVEGFILGVLIAWFYNRCSGCCKKSYK